MAPARKRGRPISGSILSSENQSAEQPGSDSEHLYTITQDHSSINRQRTFSTSSSILNTPDSGGITSLRESIRLAQPSKQPNNVLQHQFDQANILSRPLGSSTPFDSSSAENFIYKAGLNAAQVSYVYDMLNDIKTRDDAIVVQVVLSARFLNTVDQWKPDVSNPFIRNLVKAHIVWPKLPSYKRIIAENICNYISEHHKSTYGLPDGFFTSGATQKLAQRHVIKMIQTELQIVRALFKTEICRGLQDKEQPPTLRELAKNIYSFSPIGDIFPTTEQDKLHRASLLRTIASHTKSTKEEKKFWDIIDDSLDLLYSKETAPLIRESVLDELVSYDMTKYPMSGMPNAIQLPESFYDFLPENV